jgi:hypothetical protein
MKKNFRKLIEERGEDTKKYDILNELFRKFTEANP